MTSSVVTMATITNRRVLTSRDAQKTVLELELDWSEVSLSHTIAAVQLCDMQLHVLLLMLIYFCFFSLQRVS